MGRPCAKILVSILVQYDTVIPNEMPVMRARYGTANTSHEPLPSTIGELSPCEPSGLERQSSIDPNQHHSASRSPSTTPTMSSQRVGLRLAQQQLRSSSFRPALRSTLQRRFASTAPSPPGQGSSKLVGTADNAFNRERAAVKAHAAATSGEFQDRRRGEAANWRD